MNTKSEYHRQHIPNSVTHLGKLMHGKRKWLAQVHMPGKSRTRASTESLAINPMFLILPSEFPRDINKSLYCETSQSLLICH